MAALINVLIMALNIYWWIVILAAAFSWLYAFRVVNMNNEFVRSIANALYQLTEPVFRPIRRMLPNLGGVDISPIIVILIIYFLQQFLATTVWRALVA